VPRVIEDSLTLDHYGMARELSLPADGNTFSNGYVNSYRIMQGILNNPKSDRRTTAGSFHVVEGPLAIPSDKSLCRRKPSSACTRPPSSPRTS